MIRSKSRFFFSPGFSLVASALGWGYEAENEVTRRTQWKSSWYSGYEKRVYPVLQNQRSYTVNGDEKAFNADQKI